MSLLSFSSQYYQTPLRKILNWLKFVQFQRWILGRKAAIQNCEESLEFLRRIQAGKAPFSRQFSRKNTPKLCGIQEQKFKDIFRPRVLRRNQAEKALFSRNFSRKNKPNCVESMDKIYGQNQAEIAKSWSPPRLRS